MAEWGRKQYAKPWPSRAHVWTWGAFFLSCLFFVFMVWLDGQQNWTVAERLYLSDYLRSGARAKAGPKMQSKYTLLQGFNAKGQMLLVIDDQVQAVKGADGRYGYVLTDEGIKAGLVRLQYVTDVYNDQRLHAFLGQWVYQNQTLWDFAKRPTYWTLAFFVRAAVRGRAEGPCAADGLEVRAAAARPGAGDDGGVQREAGPEEMADDLLPGRDRVRESRTDLVRPTAQAGPWPLGPRSARAGGDALPHRG